MEFSFLSRNNNKSFYGFLFPPLIFKTRISVMKRLLVLLIVLAVMPRVAVAKKFEAEKNGREVIAHTSRAPVAVHKVFPPYGLHKHVYAGSLQK
jgi:hypothetical protein